MHFGQILYEAGVKIRHVYFPVNCLISLLTAVDKRRSLEVGMVGNEGMTGMPFVLGIGESGVRALVQGAGDALRMPAASLSHRVRSKSAIASSAFPLHLCIDGADFANGRVQPLP